MFKEAVVDVPGAKRNEGDEIPTIEGWPAAPLVAAALDVALDKGRGREILEESSAGHETWL